MAFEGELGEIHLLDYEVASQVFADDIARQSFRFADEVSDAAYTRVTEGEKSKFG